MQDTFAAAAAKSLQSCPTLCDPINGSYHPWDSPGKNTGVGCHFLLQYMKVKSESEVAQSCPTLSDPMDCSLTGSSVHGIFQARVLEWGDIAFSGHCTNLFLFSFLSDDKKDSEAIMLLKKKKKTLHGGALSGLYVSMTSLKTKTNSQKCKYDTTP